MHKKIICNILILSLLSQFGCYSAREITVDEVLTNDKITKLTIMTKDSVRLIFEKSDFLVTNDTIKGVAKFIGQYSQFSAPVEREIPLSNIILLEVSEFDGTKTLIYIGAIIAGIVVLFMLFILASGGIHTGPVLRL